MKILHSYWTKPNLKNDNTNSWDRSAGGWTEKRYNYMSWALSCLQFRQFYDDVELVTDQKGKELLIDKFGLPYTKVSVVLDELNDYNPDLWALGKIYAYSMQKEPFLHVDGDIFIWDRFDDELESAPLVAQHLEEDYPFYRGALEEIEEHFSFIPEVIAENRQQGKPVNAYNAGVFGGNQVAFFDDYCQQAFEFVDRNVDRLNKIQGLGLFNCIFEQHLFYCLSKAQGIPTHTYLDDIDDRFIGLADFKGVPSRTKYIHTVGYYKKFSKIGADVEFRLRADHPEYFYRIEALLDSYQI